MNRYAFSLAGPTGRSGEVKAPDLQAAAEAVAGHPYVNLNREGAGHWAIEERRRTADGGFVRRVIGTLVRVG